MKDKVKKVHIEKVFIFLLFTIFAGAVVIVLSLGANIYKSLVERDNAAYEKHLGTGYIAAKIHGNDRKDAIAIGGFVNEKQDDGIKTLHIYEKIEGEWYDTRIYYYDGAIREVFTFRENEIAPEDGTEVIPAKDMELSVEGAKISISITDTHGYTDKIVVEMRSGKEVKA